jgi:hypothetical protein
VDYFELYKTKIKLEIDFGYGFKSQGIYLLTNFSSSLTTNGFTFNISGKDKMCLLNGEHGGSFSSSIVANKLESYEYAYIPLEDFNYKPGEYYYYYQDQKSNTYQYQLDYGLFPTKD